MQALAMIAAAFTGSGAPVQGGSATAAGASSVSFTFASANAAGSKLIAFVGISGSTPSGASTISDTAGNTWVLISDSTETDTTCEVAMWYVSSAAGGANTVTVTNNAGLSYDLQAWEYPSTLTALDVSGGGEDSLTFDTNTQTILGSADPYMVPTADATVIAGVYNPLGSQFEFVFSSSSNPVLPPGTWTLRNQSHNTSGATSALFDGAVPAGTAFMLNAALPEPVTQQAVLIAEDYNHPDNGNTSVYRRYPANCGPFEYYDPDTNTWALYVVLMKVESYGPVNMFKSLDEGATWTMVGTTPVTPVLWGSAWCNAVQYDNKIHVLWEERHPGTGTDIRSLGFFVSTFDMSTDSWTATTPAAPGTSSISPNRLAYDLVVPAEDTFIVIYNNEFYGTPTTTDIMINRYSGGAWATATLFASGSILCGLSFDVATLTTYVVFQDWHPEFTAPIPTRTLKVSAVTSYSWPFTPPTPVTIQAGIAQPGSTNRRTPSTGPAVRYRGKLYIPYGRPDMFGTTISGTFPSCYVSTTPTSFTSVDLTPFTAQGYTAQDEWGSTATNLWAQVIGTSLYIFWLDGRQAPARIRFCISSDGVLPAPVSQFYDLNLSMPQRLQETIVPTDSPLQAMYSISIAQIFGARIGIVANLQAPDNNFTPEAYFFTMAAPAPPTPGAAANSGYTSAPGAFPALPLNATATRYPQLEGLGLPRALTSSITGAYALIYGLRDALIKQSQKQ